MSTLASLLAWSHPVSSGLALCTGSVVFALVYFYGYSALSLAAYSLLLLLLCNAVQAVLFVVAKRVGLSDTDTPPRRIGGTLLRCVRTVCVCMRSILYMPIALVSSFSLLITPVRLHATPHPTQKRSR